MIETLFRLLTRYLTLALASLPLGLGLAITTLLVDQCDLFHSVYLPLILKPP